MVMVMIMIDWNNRVTSLLRFYFKPNQNCESMTVFGKQFLEEKTFCFKFQSDLVGLIVLNFSVICI